MSELAVIVNICFTILSKINLHKFISIHFKMKVTVGKFKRVFYFWALFGYICDYKKKSILVDPYDRWCIWENFCVVHLTNFLAYLSFNLR